MCINGCIYVWSSQNSCISTGSRCQLAYLAAAAFLVSAWNGENAVLIAVAVHLCAEDVRATRQELLHRKWYKSLSPADVIIVGDARSTGLTFLAVFFVKPAADVRAATRHDALYLKARRQLILEERNSCFSSLPRTTALKTWLFLTLKPWSFYALCSVNEIYRVVMVSHINKKI